jgi:hypothetical protein
VCVCVCVCVSGGEGRNITGRDIVCLDMHTSEWMPAQEELCSVIVVISSYLVRL